MSSIAKTRLQEELRKWRFLHPVGFSARPARENGVDQIMRWQCEIPGQEGTSWCGRQYTVIVEFPDEYPAQPPICRFTPPIFHLNVEATGNVCLRLLGLAHQGGLWKSKISVNLILVAIQRLLCNPNETDSHNPEALKLYAKSRSKYYARIKQNPFCSSTGAPGA